MENAANMVNISTSEAMEKINTNTIDFSQNKSFVYQFKENRMVYLGIKRFCDILLSLIGLIVMSPLLLIVAVAIKLDSPGKVIYANSRIGKDGKGFKMYKFRSMCADADKKLEALQSLNEASGPVFKIVNDPRLTRVGKFIRKCSIDELPQLINIIIGDMSIVGPRPPLPNEVEQYTPHQKLRLSVTPGLTCYWQINGRSNTKFDKWVELDLEYIENRNLWIDFYLIFKTIPVVLGRKGAY